MMLKNNLIIWDHCIKMITRSMTHYNFELQIKKATSIRCHWRNCLIHCGFLIHQYQYHCARDHWLYYAWKLHRKETPANLQSNDFQKIVGQNNNKGLVFVEAKMIQTERYSMSSPLSVTLAGIVMILTENSVNKLLKQLWYEMYTHDIYNDRKKIWSDQ